jgi:hypothetical protein
MKVEVFYILDFVETTWSLSKLCISGLVIKIATDLR